MVTEYETWQWYANQTQNVSFQWHPEIEQWYGIHRHKMCHFNGILTNNDVKIRHKMWFPERQRSRQCHRASFNWHQWIRHKRHIYQHQMWVSSLMKVFSYYVTHVWNIDCLKKRACSGTLITNYILLKSVKANFRRMTELIMTEGAIQTPFISGTCVAKGILDVRVQWSFCPMRMGW